MWEIIISQINVVFSNMFSLYKVMCCVIVAQIVLVRNGFCIYKGEKNNEYDFQLGTMLFQVNLFPRKNEGIAWLHPIQVIIPSNVAIV